MIYINNLITALEEWDEKVGEERLTKLSGIVSTILLQLGNDDYKKDDYNYNALNYLRKRLEDIHLKTNVVEELLVDGVLMFLNQYFSSRLPKRESYISNNERLLKNAEQRGFDDQFIESTKKAIQTFKDDSYPLLCEKELSAWDEVTDKYFSEANREKMSDEKALIEYEKLKVGMSIKKD